MDASTGRLLTQLVDANLATICPVNKPHPCLDLIISGSSRSLYAWRPVQKGGCLVAYMLAAHACRVILDQAVISLRCLQL